MDFNDEDNNPFAGTSHLFASGIANINGDAAASSFYFNNSNNNNNNEHTDGFMNHDTSFASSVSTANSALSAAADSHYEAYVPILEEDAEDMEETPVADDGVTHHSTMHPYDTNPPITITDAGHFRDMNGSRVIAYTINFDGVEIRRRYSEFDSLRANLSRLFPTLIIPSIPEKHSIVKYFINPLNAKNDLKVIEKRKRLLTVFLQRCYNDPQISESFIFKQFLSPNVNWNDVLKVPPISILPSSNLLAPPLNPTKPSPLHLLLPIPQSSSINNYKPREEDRVIEKSFQEYEQIFKYYKQCSHGLVKNIKKQKRHFKGLVKDLGELGAYYNAFSLEDKVTELSIAIEKTGQAIDISYLNSEAFNFKILTILEEPITEIMNDSNECLNVLHFRRLKTVQLFIIDTTIKRRRMRLESLINAREQSQRLEEVLKRNAEQSPTIAAAVKRLENGESIKKVSPWQRFINGSGNGSPSDDIANMNDHERNLEMEKLENELVKLEDCLRVILKDIEQINESIKENINNQLNAYNLKWKAILRNYTKSVLIWLNDNLKSWEDAKEEIDAIDIKKPTEIV